MPSKAGILCLFPGKDDSGALDHVINSIDPSAATRIVALDTVRNKNQDFTLDEPYSSICTAVFKGAFCCIGGGPMCRTVSVRRQIPGKDGVNRAPPLRGRSDALFWGLPHNNLEQQTKVDHDSLLMVRQMYVMSLMYSSPANKSPLGSFLEQPEDPAKCAQHIPGAHTNPSLFVTTFFKEWLIEMGLKFMSFDECTLGQLVAKSTSEAADMDYDWDGQRCTHFHPKTNIECGELARYPPEMMRQKALTFAKRSAEAFQTPMPARPKEAGSSPASQLHPVCCFPPCSAPALDVGVVRCCVCDHLFHPACLKKHIATGPCARQGDAPPDATPGAPSNQDPPGTKDARQGHFQAKKRKQPGNPNQVQGRSHSLRMPLSSDISSVVPGGIPSHAPLDAGCQSVRIGYKVRPLRDGGGKYSPGRLSPPYRPYPLVRLGSVVLQIAMAWTPTFLASLQCDFKDHPFPAEAVTAVRQALAPPSMWEIAEGQPFCLDALSHLASLAGDPDWAFPQVLKEGVPLGVDEPTLHTPGVWPLKEELRGMLWEDEPPPGLEAHDNYPSAELHSADIQATFEEEREMGMVLGPYTWEEAAEVCGCTVNELITGPMAAIEESDKIRTIYDGTRGGQNLWIRFNTKERTTAPTVHDAMHALHWLKEARSSAMSKQAEAEEARSSEMFDEGPTVQQQVASNHCWVPPQAAEEWVMLKADLAKAHRRIKILKKDWKYQVALINGKVWINKVGTYGVASAQLYWGRLASLQLRILYFLFPSIDWQFIYVDDYAWLLRGALHKPLACAIVLTLLALGAPLSWKKTVLSCINVWLGFQVITLESTVVLAIAKQQVVTQSLRDFVAGNPMTHSEIEQLLGRLVWASGCCSQLKPFLQPFFAWKEKMSQVRVKGTPSKLLRMLAAMMLAAISKKKKSPSPFKPRSNWHSASDAGAKNETGHRSVGGWFCHGEPSSKRDVFWFSFSLSKDLQPWAFVKPTPSSAIAAMELYASLVTLYLMLRQMPRSDSVEYFVPLCTDNQGNTYSILKQAARKWPSSALLMELFLQAAEFGTHLMASHVHREFNTWADDLVNQQLQNFDQSKRLDWLERDAQWVVLPYLMVLGEPSSEA